MLAIAADQPFRFPATFTFVVRAFSGAVVGYAGLICDICATTLTSDH